jgi:hypothetical protein
MIYVDFSHLLISCYFAHERELGEVEESDFRKHVLHTLFVINNKHKHQFGKLVICCEGGKSWRHKVYPHYKALRKLTRAEDAIKWKEIDRLNRLIRDEIAAHNVFKIISVIGAEGDDVVATLAKTFQEPSLIISEDKDFHQLHALPYVHQYSRRRDVVYKSECPEEDLKEKIIRGDRNDSIPNVHSKDEVFVLKERQVIVSAKMFEKYNSNFYIGESGIPETFKANFERNKLLIDFDNIPQDIQESILNEFNKEAESELFSRGKRTHYLVQAGINPNSF